MNSVVLQGVSTSGIVQMFDEMAVDAAVISQFPNGTRCANLEGPIPTSIEGIRMRFYMLDCNGTVGYVNGKWVD